MADDKKVTWIELFFDLVFVAAAHQVALLLKQHLGFQDIVFNLFIFIMLLWMWLSHTMYTSRFGEKSKIYGLYTIITMAGTLAVVVFSAQPFDEFVFLISSIYALLRILLGVMYGLAALFRPGKIIHLAPLITTILCSSILWLVSGFTPFPVYIWIVAFTIDILTPFISRSLLDRIAVHATHLPERLGLLTVVMLGEMIISLVAGLYEQALTFDHLVFIAASVSAIASIFMVYFHYVDKEIVDSQRAYSLMYVYTHIPLYVSLVIIAAGLKGIASLNELKLLLIVGIITFALSFRLIKFASETRFQRRQIIALLFFLMATVVYFFSTTPLVITTAVYLALFIIYLVISESIGVVAIMRTNKVVRS